MRGSLRQCPAICSVSESAKESTTSGTKPARRADAASARPDTAAISSARSLPGKLLRKSVRFAKIEIDRLFGLDHLSEQSGLGLVFDVTDRERADADGSRARQRLCVV